VRYDSDSFHDGTYAWFVPCDAPSSPPDFESFSGSRYWYLTDGVVRESDHWGYGIGSCNWFLYGVNSQDSFFGRFYETVSYPSIGPECGFVAWADIKPVQAYYDEREKERSKMKDLSAIAKTALYDADDALRWLTTDIDGRLFDECEASGEDYHSLSRAEVEDFIRKCISEANDGDDLFEYVVSWGVDNDPRAVWDLIMQSSRIDALVSGVADDIMYNVESGNGWA
jgi:hypothetical protein